MLKKRKKKPISALSTLDSRRLFFTLSYAKLPMFRSSSTYMDILQMFFIHTCTKIDFSNSTSINIIIVVFRFKRQTLRSDNTRIDSSERFLFLLSFFLPPLLSFSFFFYHFIISSGCLLIGKRNHVFYAKLSHSRHTYIYTYILKLIHRNLYNNKSPAINYEMKWKTTIFFGINLVS